jgi:hypothetical protein
MFARGVTYRTIIVADLSAKFHPNLRRLRSGSESRRALSRFGRRRVTLDDRRSNGIIHGSGNADESRQRRAGNTCVDTSGGRPNNKRRL